MLCEAFRGTGQRCAFSVTAALGARQFLSLAAGPWEMSCTAGFNCLVLNSSEKLLILLVCRFPGMAGVSGRDVGP